MGGSNPVEPKEEKKEKKKEEEKVVEKPVLPAQPVKARKGMKVQTS